MEPDERDTEGVRRERYSRLPTPIRAEDLRAGEDGGPEPFQRGEHDTEIEWLLRTAGLG